MNTIFKITLILLLIDFWISYEIGFNVQIHKTDECIKLMAAVERMGGLVLDMGFDKNNLFSIFFRHSILVFI